MTGVETRFADILSRGWWRLLLRGLAAIAFGLLTLFRPGISLAALVLLFGLYALVDGILDVWTAIEGRKENDHWWVMLLGGLLGIVVGFIALTTPGITALALLFYIAIWAIARGVLQIVAAIRLRREIEGEWLLVLGGLATVLFGLLLITRPGAGALAVLWLIGVYAIIFGIILVSLAFKVRGFAQRVEKFTAGRPSNTW
jgi:uncharacterized membrane protein HdeD (DUF308 family)